MTGPPGDAADLTAAEHRAVRGLIDAAGETALLRDILRAISSGLEVDLLAAAVARLTTAATATDACVVHILDDSERSLAVAGATPPFDTRIGRVRLPVGSGISGWVARHREPVVIAEGKESDPRYAGTEPAATALAAAGFTSMASVPMETDRGRLVGVLEVHTVERREFARLDLELLVVIGRLVAGALHQARLHRQLAARERAHEDFAEQVIAAQEQERQRLAWDIHDGISQRLVTLSYRLDAAARAVPDDPDEVSEQLARARELVDLTLDEARSAIGGLRPPVLDDLGLAGGLASLARSVPDLDLDVDLALADDRLPEHIEIALYRIAQEALQNILKHSRATVARLWFAVSEGVARLEISDDGVGFDAVPPVVVLVAGDSGSGGYGLRSMAERAELVGGRLSVRSRPGSGTTVVVTVPLVTPEPVCPASSSARRTGGLPST